MKLNFRHLCSGTTFTLTSTAKTTGELHADVLGIKGWKRAQIVVAGRALDSMVGDTDLARFEGQVFNVVNFASQETAPETKKEEPRVILAETALKTENNYAEVKIASLVITCLGLGIGIGLGIRVL